MAAQADCPDPARSFLPMVLACLLALPGLVCTPFAHADEQPAIDREALIFFVEDGLSASLYAGREDDVISALYGAESWLQEAEYTNVDIGEAVQHAKKVIARVDRELPELRQDLMNFPQEGPSFPPVFYWFDDWVNWRRASLDLIGLQVEHMRDLTNAVAAGDFERSYDVQTALQEDRLAFQPYFDEITDVSARIFPEGHPERILSDAYGKWETHTALAYDRGNTSDDAVYRELTLQIAAELNRIGKRVESNADDLEAALGAHRAALAPYVVVLTRNEAKAEAVLDRYIASYALSVDALREIAQTHKDAAAHELKIWRDGMTSELYAGYSAFQYRYEPLFKSLSDGWTERSRILADAIAR